MPSAASLTRRSVASLLSLAPLSSASVRAEAAPAPEPLSRRSAPKGSSRYRVICDNDYAGDPDGLFQLAHHALSPSIDLVAVISSHLAVGDPFDPGNASAAHGAATARRVLALARRSGVTVLAGGESPLANRNTPQRSAASAAIVAEAMREDPRPLFVVCGAGLTEVASAYLTEPRIAERLTLIWIGGPEHRGLALPPPRRGGFEVSEYNERIDLLAAQLVFASPIPLWQVPRDAYRQVLVSCAELDERVRPTGALGGFLVGALDDIRGKLTAAGLPLAETYVLGDSPLVLLTALQSQFEPDPSSSRYVMLAAPNIADDGSYVPNPNGRPIRVYTQIDTRLIVEDLVAKLKRLDQPEWAGPSTPPLSAGA